MTENLTISPLFAAFHLHKCWLLSFCLDWLRRHSARLERDQQHEWRDKSWPVGATCCASNEITRDTFPKLGGSSCPYCKVKLIRRCRDTDFDRTQDILILHCTASFRSHFQKKFAFVSQTSAVSACSCAFFFFLSFRVLKKEKQNWQLYRAQPCTHVEILRLRGCVWPRGS